jgi:hypothetical protein
MSERHDTPSVNPLIGSQQLYRLFDADGVLLYVGISYSAIARFAQHKAAKSWIGDVCTVTIETHDVSRSEIEAMEAAAIRSEKPRYNVVHRRGTVGPALYRHDRGEGFGHDALSNRHQWWRALRELGELARELDEGEYNGDFVPSRDQFIEAVLGATKALRYGDACDKCDAITPPHYIIDGGGWLECFYACPECQVRWTCGYRSADAA